MELHLIGAGRHPRTRELRRQTRHQRRSFWIGPLHVSPQKRFTVNTEFCAKHYDQIVVGISNGTVLVQHVRDKFVDAEELRVLCFGSPKEQDDLLAANAEQTRLEAEEAERVAAAKAEEVNAQVAAELAAALAAEEAAALAALTSEEADAVKQVEEALGDTAPAATETDAVDPLPPGDAPATEVVQAYDIRWGDTNLLLDPEPATEAPAEEAPATEPTEALEAAPEEPASETALSEPEAAALHALPEGWETGSVPDLLAHATRLGLKVEGTPSRKSLVKLIKKGS